MKSHRPFFFDDSIAAIPASCIRPSAIRSAARSLEVLDQC